MKNIFAIFIIAAFIIGTGSCSNRGQGKGNTEALNDTSTVPDTGFTGIRQYFSNNSLTYEVTFKNGIRHGLMKTYYPNGKLRQTFWYENGMREDTAIWYQEDGIIFRKTPFRRDSMNGVQIQYYRTGKVRAKLEFVNGLRKPYLEEFSSDGRQVTNYPEVIINIKDNYNLNGSFIISVGLSKKDVKANYYTGDYIDGLFVPKKLKKINSSETTGSVTLRKTGSPGATYVGIIAEIMTPLGNRLLVYKKVDLPYNDLK